MQLRITDQTGTVHDIEGPEGWRLMEVIRESGLPIKAECGGACSCATCHVYVSLEWTEKLIPMRADEEDMLDAAFDVQANSRLSCQIILDESHDGLSVTLAPGTEP